MGERVFWQAPRSRMPRYARPVVHLLSIFDELTVAYRDRPRPLGRTTDVERMLTMGAALTSVIVADGRVVGTWRRVTTRGAAHVTTDPFHDLTHAQATTLDAAVDRYTTFVSAPTDRD